jgi:prepilin peptidase CpaA
MAMTAPEAYVIATFAVVLTAAAFDWRTGRIPNTLTLGTMLLAVPLHAGMSAPGRTWDGVESSVLGGFVCLLPFLVGWRLGWVAAGDVKLVTAMGALGGLSTGLEAVFLALFCAAAFVFLRLLWSGVFLKTVGNGFAVAANRTFARGSRTVEPRQELTSTVRLGPFALAGAALTLVLHGGLV